MDSSGRLGRAMVGHLPALRRYALGLCGNISAADDLVQDGIERALRRIGSLENEERMASWLRTILFNLFIDARRRMKHRGEGIPMEVMDHVPDHSVQPDGRQEAGDVLRALSFLNPEHRQVLILVGVEGLSYREAATEIGVPLGTVMSRLARARDQLRGLLDKGIPPVNPPLAFRRSG